ncbi:serine protease [Methylocystis sp.]|uniref:S1C family serine protease n=1 Tax=Methylocystis sp. TaxID=1911079 RepID=UPI0025DD9071|nr:serine protease [Methylocystis sp.]
MARLFLTGLLLGCLAIASSPTNAEQYGITVSPDQRFSVDGLAVGGSVNPASRAYRSYKCRPSEDYPGFTWCVRNQRKRINGENVSVTTTIVHSADGFVAYINQFIQPAHFTIQEIENELTRLSTRFGSAPQMKKMTDGPGGLMALLAAWNDIDLQPLNRPELNVLAQGGSVHAGVLVDLIGDFHNSARMQLPVYRVAGGKGFVWVGSFDQRGKGKLRFFAMDPSLMQLNTVAIPPAPQPREMPDDGGKPNSRAGVSTGTGFFVSQNGFVITNAHVVEGCDAVQVSGALSKPVIAAVTTRDIADDLALIKTDSKPSVFASLRAGVRLGESVSAFGYPLTGILATGGNFTTGNVSALAGLRNDAKYLQITAPIQPGNSGGPVLDQEGDVVGVVVAKLNVIEMAQATNDVAQNVNFAIKTSVLVNFLEANGVPYSTASTPLHHLQPADLADRAKSMSVLISCATNQ